MEILGAIDRMHAAMPRVDGKTAIVRVYGSMNGRLPTRRPLALAFAISIRRLFRASPVGAAAIALMVGCGGAEPTITTPGARAVCPEGMIHIPGTTWHVPAHAWSGFRDTEEHDVPIRPLCMDRTLVTVAAYEACVESGACQPADRPTDESLSPAVCNANHRDRLDHPINCVSWHQSATYCAVQNKRLPDDDEWVYAVLAGDLRRTYPWGWNEPATQLCWSGVEPRSSTCPAGALSQGANPWGVLDLLGNVRQWTAPLIETSMGGSPGKLRVLRGVAYDHHEKRFLTPNTQSESMAPAFVQDPRNGFRCVRSL
jgi:formylglycine-generating enzyme required for sulfatase activity